MSEFSINDSDLAHIKGAVVVITGASSGIGLATTDLLLKLGAKVVGGDLQPPQGSVEEHADFRFRHCDVTVWADQVGLFETAIQQHGRVDHAFANAGIAAGGDEYFEEHFDADSTPQEPHHSMLMVNQIGAANTIKLGIHYIRKNKNGGSIVATSSAAGYLNGPVSGSLTDYGVSKAAIIALVRALGRQLSERQPNVRINSLAPSYTSTAIFSASMQEKLQSAMQPAKEVGRAAIACMVDSQRQGHSIFVQASRFYEVSQLIQRAVSDIVPLRVNVSKDDLSRVSKELKHRKVDTNHKTAEWTSTESGDT